MDIIQELGELAIGSRLKRLSDYIMNDGRAIYKAFNIDFEPKWFPIYFFLSRNEEASVMEIAENLNMLHPTVIKLAKELEAKGYVDSKKDSRDGRKRILFLSAKGKELLPEIELAWKDIASSISGLIQSQQHNLLNAIAELEDKFGEKGFANRVKAFREKRLLDEIKIVDYKPEYGKYFARINYDWIEKYFKVEPIDIESLENHKEKILDKGGAILFAKLDGKIVGTCALIKWSDEEYELAKMGVDENYRGKKIGKKIGLAILEKAKELGAKSVFLESNKTLKPAINLYYALGFKVTAGTIGESDYERADIRMSVDL